MLVDWLVFYLAFFTGMKISRVSYENKSRYQNLELRIRSKNPSQTFHFWGPEKSYPFRYFEKYPISLKQIWQISLINSDTLILVILTYYFRIPTSPLIFRKKIHVYWLWAKIIALCYSFQRYDRLVYSDVLPAQRPSVNFYWKEVVIVGELRDYSVIFGLLTWWNVLHLRQIWVGLGPFTFFSISLFLGGAPKMTRIKLTGTF